MLAGITGHKYWQASEDEEWLCSGRYIADDGFMVYDYRLAIWLTVSGLIIALSYFAIPALIQKVRKERDDIKGAVDETLLKFITFIVMCGVGHAIDAVNIYLHYYYIAAGWHLATGIISFDTLLSLRRHAGYFLNMPTLSFFQEYQDVSERVQQLSNIGMWWYNLETEEVRWTKGMKKIYGKSEDWETDLAVIDKMVHPESREHYEKETANHRKHGGNAAFEYYVLVNGDKRLFRATIIVADNGKWIYGYVQDLSASTIRAKDIIANISGSDNEKISILTGQILEMQQALNSLKLSKK